MSNDSFYFFEMVCLEFDPMGEFTNIEQHKANTEIKSKSLENDEYFDCLEYYLK